MKANETQGLIKKVLKEWLPKDANPAVWDASKQIHAAYLADAKEQVKKATEAIETKSKEAKRYKTLTDEERADALSALLDAKLQSQNISAAEIAQLKDLFNLRQQDRDVIIEVVSYKDV